MHSSVTLIPGSGFVGFMILELIAFGTVLLASVLFRIATSSPAAKQKKVAKIKEKDAIFFLKRIFSEMERKTDPERNKKNFRRDFEAKFFCLINCRKTKMKRKCNCGYSKNFLLFLLRIQ